TIIANINRGGTLLEETLTVDSLGRLGVLLYSDIHKFLNVTTINYTILSALPAGASKTISTLTNYVKELGLIFSPKTEAYKSVGSFITIGSIFPSSWVWEVFWNITAWLSIMLAVVNLIPIPALDGGHILFVLYEMITRRKPSDKFLEYAQIAGLIIILGLVFLSFGNDIYRLFK
ncbi:MAG: site-2 protease family protein, partial [Bacteroidales bacterium]|nr:site-2 protease family protein [Bacteroidales bacterium]